MAELGNMSVIKTYSVDLTTVDLIKQLAKRLSIQDGEKVSEGRVIRMAVRGLADRLDEEDAAEAEAERDEYELEEAAADASYE